MGLVSHSASSPPQAAALCEGTQSQVTVTPHKVWATPPCPTAPAATPGALGSPHMASYQGPNSCCSIGFFCWNLWSFSGGSGKQAFSKVDLYAALPLADTEEHTEQQGRRGSPLPTIRPAPSSELVSGPTALLPAQLPAGAPRGAAADSPRACQQSLASGFTWHTLSCRDLDKRTERSS